MKRSFFWCFSIVLFTSCSAQESPNWWEKPADKWPQILLRNHLNFKGRKPVSGASAFALYYKGDTVICTARHVIEKPIGIIPSVPQDSANLLMNAWKLTPPATPNFDSIPIRRLINTTPSSMDFLVLDADFTSKNITPVAPAQDVSEINEEVSIIGCERNDKDCTQHVYPATISVISDKQIIIKPELEFNPMGFSGAPVVNKKGEAIGVVFGTSQGKEGFYLYLVPIHHVLPFIGQ